MMNEPHYACSDHSFLSIIQDGSWANPTISPYHMSLVTCHAVALFVFVVSIVTGNFSQVDKLWSILPAIYAWTCVVDDRTYLMAILSTLWSIRLTYNFYRRGGYTFPNIFGGDEDYRWEILRRGTLGGYWTLLTNKWIMVVFNLVFISVYQNFLLLYIATPSHVAWSMAMDGMHCGDDNEGQAPPLNILDGIASVLFLAALIVEGIADNQQFNFQRRKREWKASIGTGTGGSFANAFKNISSQTSLNEFSDGFCQTNLFGIVRKPMYAAEQSIWISFYIFSIAAKHSSEHLTSLEHYWNWSGGGFVLLCMLFQGSGWLTEQISISKYPQYRVYQQKVPLYVPRISTLWRVLAGTSSDAKKD